MAFIGKHTLVSLEQRDTYDVAFRYIVANSGNTELMVEQITTVRSADNPGAKDVPYAFILGIS